MSKSQFFPLHCPSRNAISSKVFNGFSKAFFDWKTRKVAFVVENFNCTEFWLCNSIVTNFPTSGKCKNFNFSLHTVPAEMPYLQKCLTDFQKLYFDWKTRKVAFVVENFNCTECFGLAISNVTNFSNIWKM